MTDELIQTLQDPSTLRLHMGELTASELRTAQAAVRFALAQLPTLGHAIVPKEPAEDLLISMAVRSDHGLGVPGYYDQPIFGGEGVGHQKRLEAAVREMRQLHEEVVGNGFHSPERAGMYIKLRD